MLERGEVANSWRHERWDSLRLLTPNWLTRLPGAPYAGDDPDGYMSADEVADVIVRFGRRPPRPCSTRHDGDVRARGARAATGSPPIRARSPPARS